MAGVSRFLEQEEQDFDVTFAHHAAMRELFDIIRSNPWPFGAGLLVVVIMIIAENFGRGIQGDGDFGFGDGDGGDGGGD
jgi:hypothetical protein